MKPGDPRGWAKIDHTDVGIPKRCNYASPFEKCPLQVRGKGTRRPPMKKKKGASTIPSKNSYPLDSPLATERRPGGVLGGPSPLQFQPLLNCRFKAAPLGGKNWDPRQGGVKRGGGLFAGRTNISVGSVCRDRIRLQQKTLKRNSIPVYSEKQHEKKKKG